MTVAELMRALKDFPPEVEVVCDFGNNKWPLKVVSGGHLSSMANGKFVADGEGRKHPVLKIA